MKLPKNNVKLIKNQNFYFNHCRRKSIVCNTSLKYLYALVRFATLVHKPLLHTLVTQYTILEVSGQLKIAQNEMTVLTQFYLFAYIKDNKTYFILYGGRSVG